jgi:hypothetical protein
MKAVTLYRIASVLLVLFAAGHTFGFLKFKSPTAEGIVVRDAMNNVHFQVGGSSFSYGGFYTGFGLTISVYMLFMAFLAWHLGTVAGSNPQAIGSLGWVFCAVQAVSLILDWKYFSVEPVIFSAVLTVCLGWAAWLVKGKG